MSQGELDNHPDGEVTFTGKLLVNADFTNEKDLSDYLMANIRAFCRDYLDDVLIEASTELEIMERFTFAPRGKCVDIHLDCENSSYIIELKTGKYQNTSRAGVVQLLDYGLEFPDSNKKLILMSTRFDLATAKVIKHYNLPIRYMYINRRQICEYLGDG